MSPAVDPSEQRAGAAACLGVSGRANPDTHGQPWILSAKQEESSTLWGTGKLFDAVAGSVWLSHVTCWVIPTGAGCARRTHKNTSLRAVCTVLNDLWLWLQPFGNKGDHECYCFPRENWPNCPARTCCRPNPLASILMFWFPFKPFYRARCMDAPFVELIYHCWSEFFIFFYFLLSWVDVL